MINYTGRTNGRRYLCQKCGEELPTIASKARKFCNKCRTAANNYMNGKRVRECAECGGELMFKRFSGYAECVKCHDKARVRYCK